MLQVVYGVGTSINAAASRAIEEYNKIQTRKTFHLRDYTHYKLIEQSEEQFYQCEIWFEVPDSTPEEQQAAKFEFIGSTEIDPNDPNWRQKWLEQQGIDQETLDADWRLNTDPIHNASVSS